MNKLLLEKNIDLGNRTKALAVSQKVEDADSITHIRKSFVYKLFYVQEQEPLAEHPEVVIRKIVDTKRRVEKFSFYVTGFFYMNHKRMMLKVGFRHTLDIDILWKDKNFSSKKSAVMT